MNAFPGVALMIEKKGQVFPAGRNGASIAPQSYSNDEDLLNKGDLRLEELFLPLSRRF
jgi:hypothetical protein